MDTAAPTTPTLSRSSVRLFSSIAVGVLLALVALAGVLALGVPMEAGQETVVMAPIRW